MLIVTGTKENANNFIEQNVFMHSVFQRLHPYINVCRTECVPILCAISFTLMLEWCQIIQKICNETHPHTADKRL